MQSRSYSLTSEEENNLRAIHLVPVFCGIGYHEQHLVARRCHVEEVPENRMVIEQDASTNNLFIILEGKVQVSTKNNYGVWAKVATLSKGDYFGEIALLKNIRRTARVTTKTHCTFLTISALDFLAIYQHFPPHSRDNIQLEIAKRLKELAAF